MRFINILLLPFFFWLISCKLGFSVKEEFVIDENVHSDLPLPLAFSLTSTVIVLWGSMRMMEGQTLKYERKIYIKIFDFDGMLLLNKTNIHTSENILFSFKFEAVRLLKKDSPNKDHFVLIWTKHATGTYDSEIFGKVFSVNFENEKKTNVTSITEFDLGLMSVGTDPEADYHPVLAAFPDGSFVVAYHVSSDVPITSYQLYDQNFQKEGTRTKFQNSGGFYRKYPFVCCLDDGNFVIAYQMYDDPSDSKTGIFFRKIIRKGNVIGRELHANTVTFSNQAYPEIIRRNGGGFLIYYSNVNLDVIPNLVSVLAQKFDSNGNKEGEEVGIPFLDVSKTVEWGDGGMDPSIRAFPSKFGEEKYVVSYELVGKNQEINLYFQIYDLKNKKYSNYPANGFLVNDPSKSVIRSSNVWHSHDSDILPNGNVVFIWGYNKGNENYSSVYARIVSFNKKGENIITELVLVFFAIGSGILFVIIFLLIFFVFVVVCLFWALNYGGIRRKGKKKGKTYEKIPKKVKSKKGNGKFEEVELCELPEDERILAFNQDFLQNSESFQKFKKELFDKNPDLLKNLFKIDYNDVNLTSYIATGGGGSIYKGTWKGIEVVYKAFSLGGLKTEDVLDSEFERFSKEMKIFLNLSEKHDNILNLYGFILQESKLGLISEFCKYGDVKKFLQKHPYLKMEQRVRICYEICKGLSFLHSKNVIHRDIKPDNVLVGENMTSKIMDFGLSRIVTKTLINKTVAVGSSRYISPEQFSGSGNYNSSTDVFSLGISMYEILSNNFNPFNEGKYDEENISMRISKDPNFRPDLKSVKFGEKFSFLKEILSKSWEHEPENRLSASEICSIFEKNGVIDSPKKDLYQERKPITIYLRLKEGNADDSEDFEFSHFVLDELKALVVKKWKFEEFLLFLKKGDSFVELDSDEKVFQIKEDDVICVEKKK